MSGNESFELVSEMGWRRGFANMLRSGLDRWFKTLTWWINCLIWGSLLAAILLAIVFDRRGPLLEPMLMITLGYMGIFPAVGVIIIMQDAIVAEKREGTAAWLLSKPLTRPAFVLSKMIANSIGVLLTMTIVPCAIAFAIIALSVRSALSPLGTVEAIGVIFINLFFFLTLTLMLGTLFSNRGPVIGIPLALLFMQQVIIGIKPFLGYFLPWTLISPAGDIVPIAYSLLKGSAVSSGQLLNLSLVFAESIIFAMVGIWYFKREEF